MLIKSKAIVTLFALSAFKLATAQETFNERASTCYCTTSGNSLSGIVKYDNNYQLLKELKKPHELNELTKKGISYTQSQIKLLETFKYIHRENNKYITNIPILDSAETATLRNFSRRITNEFYPHLKPIVRDFVRLTTSMNNEKNTFTLLFSYVLDHLAWTKMENKNLIEKRVLTPENPLWKGEYWILHSPRGFSCGTNSYDKSNYTIAMNWSYDCIQRLLPFVRNNLTNKFITSFINHTLAGDSLAGTFSDFGLTDEKGKLTIPIISVKKKDELYKSASRFTDVIANLISQIQIDSLLHDLKLANRSQAIILSWHEIMWDLLERLIEEKIISLPVPLRAGSTFSNKDLGVLFFLIES